MRSHARGFGVRVMHAVFEKTRANKFSFRSAFIYMAVRAEFFTERNHGPLLADEYRRIYNARRLKFYALYALYIVKQSRADLRTGFRRAYGGRAPRTAKRRC